MIRKNTKISSLGIKEIYSISNMALRWCRRTMGTNRRRKYEPIWTIRKGYDTTCGEFDCDDNTVFIYWNNCRTVDDLISTCIHEWTHQLQPIASKYWKYDGDYESHPMENEARLNEKNLTPQLWKYINPKINKYERSN
jgi:hypothetical protein